MGNSQLQVLQSEIINCRLCPRLVEHREAIAQVKRRAYHDWTYWGRPVPSFGDPNARVLIAGLAPGAHGSNRTGRMFTGDRSGDILYKVLFDTGFASKPASTSASDGLTLTDAYITAAAHCAPPGNKPTPEEFRNCRPYLERELELLSNVRVVVALGRLAFDIYLGILKLQNKLERRSLFAFGHNILHILETGQGGSLPALISSYHPSQQNTSTGKLTEPMLRAVFENAQRLIRDGSGDRGRRGRASQEILPDDPQNPGSQQ